MTQPSFFERTDDGVTKVKICGVTSAEDAGRIVSLGADSIGVNFWPKSKRHVRFNEVEDWLQDLGGSITRIGVFVNAAVDRIERILDSGAIDAAQLHGDESTGLLSGLQNRGYKAFKGLGIRDRDMLNWVPDFTGKSILLDAYAPMDYGGTGETIDWSLGREAVERWPERKIILAGGLTPENVADAIRQVHPFAVDVASGVEVSPGVKDPEKVAAFIRNSREA